MKTLADLKRDAKSGNLYAEMVYRFGQDIPERLTGKRKLIDSNTVGITFLNGDGKKSELRIEAASLVEYDGDKLTVYAPGERELTKEEQVIFDQWKRITDTEEYQRELQYDLMADGSSTYWKKKSHFQKSGYEYLLGYDTIRGKKYQHNTGKIKDNSVKGNMLMQYQVC